MKKIFTLVVLYSLTVQFANAQVVSKANVKQSTVNFSDLVAFEAANPDLVGNCETCPKKPTRWFDINIANMPIPAGANIKKQKGEDVFPNGPTNPTPMAPSRLPAQDFLGHTDPGNTIPPDTHGAVGLSHVITATNDFIKIHAKIGGAQISQVTLSTFTGVPSTCDPYMLFDPSTQRWIFSAIGCAGAGNQMILMVSNTSNPTGAWTKITWIPTGPSMLLDHPYLGYDDQKIILSGRRFQGGTTFVGSSLFLVDKAAMLAGTPINFGVNAQQIDKLTADGDAPCPVTIYEPPFSTVANPSPGTNYILQSWNGGASAIRLTTVTGNIPTATWNTGTAVFPVGGTAWNSGNMGNAAEQMIETRKLAANDARISSAVMMNGKIWAAHHIAFPSTGTPTSIDVQWWQLQGTPGGTFGDVLQRGRVGSAVGDYKWFPGIAVNKNEDVIIGYSSSNASTRVNAAYATRQSTTAANTTDAEFVYHAGVDRYWKDFGSPTQRARWGDYTHSALDPVDNSLWTIQQYASTGAGPIPPDNNSRSGVWWAQVPPSVLAGPVSVTATAGTLGPIDYTTLKLAFDAINAGTHQGVITVAINANTDEGATPAVLNSTGTGAAVYTSVSIRPSVDGVSVVGTATPASRGVIELNGADNVTLDGDNPNSPGTNRNLTVSTTSALGNVIVWLKTPSAADACTDNTIRNCNLTGQGTYTTVAGLISGGSTFGGAALAANSNNTFQNNAVKSLQNGLFISGFVTSPFDANWQIRDNLIGSSVLAEKLGFRGMILINASGYTVNNNSITGVNSSVSTSSTMTGIQLATGNLNGVISNNKISDIRQNNPGGWGCNGIWLNASTVASNTLVFNNFISDIASSGFNSATPTDNGYGIVISAGGGYNVYYNTVRMNASQISGWPAALLVTNGVTTANTLNIRNNIFAVSQNAPIINAYSVYSSAASTVYAAIDYNDYHTSGLNLGNIGGTNRANLVAWQAGTGKDVNSKNVLPVFVSATDLHLTAANNCFLDASATPIAGITTDIDLQARNATTPDIGADEIASTGCGTCVITCPSNVTVNNTPNQCGAIVNFPAPIANIDCGTVTATPASGSFFPIGTTTVNVTTTEGTSCSFTVTVVDNQPPVITCPANITVSNAAGTCGAVVTFAPLVSDNCPIGSTTALSLTQSSSTTITALNSVACTGGPNSFWRAYQLAAVAPVTIRTVTFGVEGAGAQTVNVRVHTSAGAFPGGTRTLVASQSVVVGPANNNSLVTVTLTTPPTVPANAILVLELEVPTIANSFFIGSNTAAETAPSYISAPACALPAPATFASIGFPGVRIILNAAGTVPVPGSGTVSVPASGSVFPVGTTTVTSTATDGAGNMASCTFTVTVNDTELPTITCPAAVIRNTDPAACTATFAPVNPTAADNCGVTVQTWAITGATTANSAATGINTVGSRAFNIGVSTITYTVRDAAGNSRTCTQTITINDGQLPTINTQPVNRTLCAGGTATFSVAAVTAPTAGGPLSYQWQIWNGTAWVSVTGATGATTNTLTLSNVTHSMNTNSYRVQVIGLCTTVNSNFATLYVNPLPTITLTTSIPPALIPTQVLTITATPSSAGGSYVWSKNGVVIGGATSSILNNLTVNDIGTYSVVYTDANGCVVTSSNIVITALPSDKLYVYPVPNLGVFNVRFYNQANEQVTVRVFDAKGSEVYQRKVATILPYTTINVDMSTNRIVTRGTYVVEIRRADGSLVGNRKIIVN